MRNIRFRILKQYSKMLTIIALILLVIFLYYEKCYITYSYYNEQKVTFDGYIIYFLSEGLVQVLYIPVSLIVIASQVLKDYYSNPSFAIRYKSRYGLSADYILKALAISITFIIFINVMLLIISLSAGFEITFSKMYVTVNWHTMCAGFLYMLLYYAVYVVSSSTGMSLLICGLLYIIQAVIWKGGFYSLKGLIPFYNIVANEYVTSYAKMVYWILTITALIILIIAFSGNDMGIDIAPKTIIKSLAARHNYAVTIVCMIIVTIFIVNTNYVLFKSIYHNDKTLSFIVFRGFAAGNVRDMIMNLLLILPVLAYLINYITKRIITLSVYYYMKSGSVLKLVTKTELNGLCYVLFYYLFLYVFCILFECIFKSVGEESVYDNLAKSSSMIIMLAGYIVITFTLAIIATGLYILISRFDIAIIITLVFYLLLSNVAGSTSAVTLFIPVAQNNYLIPGVLDNSLLALFIAVAYLFLALFVFYRIMAGRQEKIITFIN